MTGRLAEGRSSAARRRSRRCALSASPHELYRALFELGWTLYYSGDLDGAIAAVEESLRVDPAHGRRRDSERGRRARAGGSASRGSTPGEIERGRSILLELGGDDVARTMPVERCFDWESLTLAELAVGNADAADGYARRAEEDAARLGLKLPAALADRARAAVLLAAGEPREAARVAARSVERPQPTSARRSTPRSRAASRDARSPRPASAREAIAMLRAAPSTSSTRAARSARATSCAASCAGSARAPSRVGRRRAARAASRR